jgi:hypothetical protein
METRVADITDSFPNDDTRTPVFDSDSHGGGKKNHINKKYRKYTLKTKNKKSRKRWSLKYKKSINCKQPRGFSQRQYCKYGRKK